MIKVGITGGIGAGKSFVSAILSDWGYPIFNSDIAAKKIMSNHQEVIQKIKRLFGEKAYTNDQLNREYLAKQIFNQPDSKFKLNKIVHPVVIKSFEDWCVEKKKQSSHNPKFNLVFNEAAILFETGRYKDFDFTLLVTAPKDVRIQRILKRDKTTIEDIKSRMSNQWKDEKKKELASFVINNDGEAEVVPQLKSILELISKKGANN